MDFVVDSSGKLGYAYTFASNSVILKEEAYLYPFISFLAEFGGSLGLFLGFSFLSLWDVIIDFFQFLFIFYNPNQRQL